VTRVAIAGAGTMGSGIAEVCVLAGFETILHDPDASTLTRAREGIDAHLRRAVGRGRVTQGAACEAMRRLSIATDALRCAGSDVVVEAVPENIDLKQTVLNRLLALNGSGTILATNTSSIPITAIAAGIDEPGQVVGMHFFNPVPRMKLVEVTPALQTRAEITARATKLCEALGKRVIVARDTPGFVVNRCGRALYGEALRIVQEGVAEPPQIDRLCRDGGGFPMGPFELMDLVGIDVAFEVAKSFADLSFGEPRWRPSPLQAAMVASGRLGRKTGAGWYDYEGRRQEPSDAEGPRVGIEEALVPATIHGDGALAQRLSRLATEHGPSNGGEGAAPLLVVASGDMVPAEANVSAGTLLVCAHRSLASWGRADAIGFSVLPGSMTAELTPGPRATNASARLAETFFAGVGLQTEWTKDGPGLVLGRVVAQIVNEACFAVGEGVASAEDIDTGVKLGLNYPRGALEWGASLGWQWVLDTVDGLWRERREERFRAAPALRRAASYGALVG
jgi:3-hydroxybutyryl-CoA dehydrogenase